MTNNNFNNGAANNNNNSNNNGGFIMAQGTLTTMEAFAGTVKTAMEVYYGDDGWFWNKIARLRFYKKMKEEEKIMENLDLESMMGPRVNDALF